MQTLDREVATTDAAASLIDQELNGAVRQIDESKGKYYFLSNFYQREFTLYGKTCASGEHGFQAAKAATEENHERVRLEKTAYRAKLLARRIKLRPDWAEVKVDLMEQVLRAKFADPKMGQKLLGTGDTQLIEGNDWGDTVFGCVRGKDGEWRGHNHLGKLLMKVRADLRDRA